MSNSSKANNIKNIFIETLQFYNYNEATINALLTDNFLNGLLELQESEPENNKLISMLRNFSNEQNILSLTELNIELINELKQNSYVSDILKFINSSWMNVDFVENTSSYANRNTESEDVDNIKAGISITAGFLNFLSKTKGTGQKIIASEITVPLELARRLHNQFQSELDFSDNFEKELNAVARGDLKRLFGTAEVTRSPLVIDLDGDGVETVGTDANIHFDHDGNGFAENTGWASPDDGILIHDINNNSSNLLAA